MLDGKSVLLVISKFPPEYSGPGVRIPRLYDWLREKGNDFNLKILCNGIERTKNEIYYHDGLEVQRVTAGKFYQWFSFLPKRLSHFLIYQIEFVQCLFVLSFFEKYQNIDFLHVAGHSGGTTAALLWAKNRKIPVLMELVNLHARPYQKFFFFFTARVPASGKIAFLTRHSAEFYQKEGIPENQIWVKPNPVDSGKYNIESDLKLVFRNKLSPFKDDDVVVLSVAKFMPRKNQIFLIDVLKLLPSQFKLILAGPAIEKGVFFERDRSYLDNILLLVKKYNLSDRVHVVCDYVESDKYMKASDVYVMPAWDEGLGTPMLEAMGCGLPVVANEGEPSFREWIISGENGFLADINNPQEWAGCIEQSIHFRDNKRNYISQEIYSKAGQEKIFCEYEDIISSALKT